jgi:hypothetical protein
MERVAAMRTYPSASPEGNIRDLRARASSGSQYFSSMSFAATIAVVLGVVRLVPVRPRAHPSLGSLLTRSVLERIHAVIQ